MSDGTNVGAATIKISLDTGGFDKQLADLMASVSNATVGMSNLFAKAFDLTLEAGNLNELQGALKSVCNMPPLPMPTTKSEEKSPSEGNVGQNSNTNLQDREAFKSGKNNDAIATLEGGNPRNSKSTSKSSWDKLGDSFFKTVQGDKWTEENMVFLEKPKKDGISDRKKEQGDKWAEEYTQSLEKIKKADKSAWEVIKENSEKGWKGFTDAMNKTVDDMKTNYQLMGDLGKGFADSMSATLTSVFTDQFRHSVQTAQKYFEEFGNAMIKVIEKVAAEFAARFAMTGIARMFSGAAFSLPAMLGIAQGGNAFSGSDILSGPVLPMTAAANGAIFRQPTIGLIGEGRYPEAVIPMPNGQSIPVQFQGRGAQSSQPVNVTLQLNGRELGNVLFDMSQTGHLKLDTNVLMTNGRI